MGALRRSHYELLGLQPSEGLEAVKRAYRKMARRYHPDLNPGDPFATERFQQIFDAYHTLSDSELRSSYNLSIGLDARTWQEDPPRTEADPREAPEPTSSQKNRSDAARAAADAMKQRINRASQEGFGRAGPSQTAEPRSPPRAEAPPRPEGGGRSEAPRANQDSAAEANAGSSRPPVSEPTEGAANSSRSSRKVEPTGFFQRIFSRSALSSQNVPGGSRLSLPRSAVVRRALKVLTVVLFAATGVALVVSPERASALAVLAIGLPVWMALTDLRLEIRRLQTERGEGRR